VNNDTLFSDCIIHPLLELVENYLIEFICITVHTASFTSVLC